MPRFRWLRRHRALSAFLAGVLLSVIGLAAAGYWVLSDQRRSARALAGALSQALAREVRIERVTDLGTARVVMRGVELPSDGGWPATIVADRVEATGPLLAAARGEAAPVRLTVSGPTVLVPAEGGGGLGALAALGESLRGFLANPLLLDLTLAGGTARRAGRATAFELTLLKEREFARAELILSAAEGPPLRLLLEARPDAGAARLMVVAQGGVTPASGPLSERVVAALTGLAVDLRLDVELAAGRLTARGQASVGDALVAGGSVSFADGVLEIALPEAALDLAVAARLAGLEWTPSGRAALTQVAGTWRADADARRTLRASVRVPALAIPPAAGVEVVAERVEGRLELQPSGPGLGLSGDARAARIGVAGVELAPADTRYHLNLDGRGRLVRADLERLSARIEGGDLTGTVGYEGATGHVEARLEGKEVEIAGLVRRLAPGWLAAADRLRLMSPRVVASGLGLRELGHGTARLETKGFRLERADGHLAAAAFLTRADLARDGVQLEMDAERLAGTLPAFTGELPRVSASAALVRRPGAVLRPERVALAARDREGRALLEAALGPAPAGGRLRLTAEARALERLDRLWPGVPRRIKGSARLDLELVPGDLGTGEGRLAVSIPEGELWNGKVALRDVTADVPVRRGADGPGEPPWGTLAIGELIAYGVVVRDLTTPARVWRDRLSLNALSYLLYSGQGAGWSELELQPAGPALRGKLTGRGVRIEEFLTAYGVRGGTMTGLMRYDLDYQYRAGRLGVDGRFDVPDGGTVNIELLNRVLAFAESDPTGVVRQALDNLRAFDYKEAVADVRSPGDDIRITLSLRGRERFLVFPPKVREINVRNMPLSFLARQFPGT